MRLVDVTIKNFRGYRQETLIPIAPEITGITGRNDAGKSSILEALDIFFDGGEVTLDKDDFNVSGRDEEIEISCTFADLPASIVLDETNTTTLAAEHLLNQEGNLRILKRYKRSSPGKPAVFIIADHPSAEGCNDLHTLKISDLKKRADDFGISRASVADSRKSASWREAIWANVEDLRKVVQELEITSFAGDSKTIQAKLFDQLPLFALFRSDRESKDNDPHAKNPMQEAVKQAQAELRDEIEGLQAQIQGKVLERANLTIEKLREMDPTMASQLNPRFKTPPKWSFDFSLDGDDDIPINKRGSGVRRLILLNFFRAEAERKVAEKDAPSVIYAIEEPETSQHPSNQEMLVRALLLVGQKENCQVLVTTHVPALAGLLPTDGLRLVQLGAAGPEVLEGTDEVFAQISESLGVLPDPSVSGAKGLILVEGPGDVVFLRHAANTLKAAGYIETTPEDKNICLVVIGGCGNLKHWITKRLADQFGVPWGILLDSDVGTPEEAKNRAAIGRLKADGKKAHLTRKREPENYILPEVVTPHVKDGSALIFSDTDDAKKLIGAATLTRVDAVLEYFWPKMTADQIRQVEFYCDDTGCHRFELTEMLSDFCALA